MFEGRVSIHLWYLRFQNFIWIQSKTKIATYACFKDSLVQSAKIDLSWLTFSSRFTMNSEFFFNIYRKQKLMTCAYRKVSRVKILVWWQFWNLVYQGEKVTVDVFPVLPFFMVKLPSKLALLPRKIANYRVIVLAQLSWVKQLD